jgi:hypothetical protein
MWRGGGGQFDGTGDCGRKCESGSEASGAGGERGEGGRRAAGGTPAGGRHAVAGSRWEPPPQVLLTAQAELAEEVAALRAEAKRAEEGADAKLRAEVRGGGGEYWTNLRGGGGFEIEGGFVEFEVGVVKDAGGVGACAR